MALRTDPNLADPDGFYAALLAAHRGLGPGEARAFDAALVLLLANHVGDATVLEAALRLARDAALSVGRGGAAPDPPR